LALCSWFSFEGLGFGARAYVPLNNRLLRRERKGRRGREGERGRGFEGRPGATAKET
jgi:hypothetical protein